MKRLALAAAGALVMLAGCASSAPDARRAELMCQALANADGLRAADVGSPVAADGGYRVPMKLEDKIGRRVDASCQVAGADARWAPALPTGLARR